MQSHTYGYIELKVVSRVTGAVGYLVGKPKCLLLTLTFITNSNTSGF